MFDFPPYRPPSEANSALIRVTHGCPWNHCTFCGMYKKTSFKVRPYQDIASDIKILREVFPHSRNVFIGDSDSLLHKEILKVVQLIRATYPAAGRITSYARSHTLAHKGREKLMALKQAGLTRVHVGLESGAIDILQKIKKGAAPEMVIRGGTAAKKAELELCYYVLCGIGGNDHWQEQALETAKVLNKVNPDFIRLRTLSLIRSAPLYGQWQKQEFEPITPSNRLKETRLLLQKLEVDNCQLASDHISNYLWAAEGIIFQGVAGRLPQDKKQLLNQLDQVIEIVENKDGVMDANMLVQ